MVAAWPHVLLSQGCCPKQQKALAFCYVITLRLPGDREGEISVTADWRRVGAETLGRRNGCVCPLATVASMPQHASIAAARLAESCYGVAHRQWRHRLNGIAGNA